MSDTLGGFIKDLRIQKNIAQSDIAYALGWKETSRLSRIEQGRVEKPSRELISKLAKAMRLTDEEKNRLFLAGNYLPSKEDVKIAREKLAPLVDTWPYPASSLDFSWRVIYTNKKLYELHKIPIEGQYYIEQNLPNIMEIVFAPTYDGKQEDKSFYINMLVNFQLSQSGRTKERWYKDLIKKMLENDTFRELWSNLNTYNSEKYQIDGFAIKSMHGLKFYFFVLPVITDPRFFVEYYVPADVKTFKYYQK